MLRQTAVTLAEVLELADEEKRKGSDGTIYLQQQESAPGDTTFGDEDTGGKAEEKIRLMLETTGNSIYYADEFRDMDLYKEALDQLERLETYYSVKRVTEEEIKQKWQES